MVWNAQTRRETKHILDKIPPLSWSDVAQLFRNEDCHPGPTDPVEFDSIPDADDWKFAALAAATGAILLTNDAHLLAHRDHERLNILTPAEFWQRR